VETAAPAVIENAWVTDFNWDQPDPPSDHTQVRFPGKAT